MALFTNKNKFEIKDGKIKIKGDNEEWEKLFVDLEMKRI